MGQRGPQPIAINWEVFDQLVSYQCTQEEIAAHFNCSVDTLDNACQRDRGEKLSDVWDKKKKLGRVKLKKIQFALAEQGSASMAIFLGKYLLGQTDTPEQKLMQVIANSGLSIEDVMTLIMENSVRASVEGKRSFVDFAIKAGYPKPFEKQLDMMQFGMGEDVARMILGSRGYGKTDYVVILGIAYDLYLTPTRRNLIMTKSKERNQAILGEIQAACEKNGMTFEKANANLLRVPGLVGKDHSVSAVTVKTVSLRGRHPDRIIMDDPVTEDDTSEATRALIVKKYNELFKLCSNILIIGQPAHKFDLYAKLRGVIKTMEVPHGTIPELDHDLEAQRLAGVDESSIQASYFLKPPSEGQVAFDKIQYLPNGYPWLDSVAFIDPSHEGGDYTAITILHGYMGGIAVVGFAIKKAWNHCLDEFQAYAKKYRIRKLAFETNSLGDMPIEILRAALPGVGVVGWRSNTNKHSRIMAAGAFSESIFLSHESNKAYHDQVTQYEYNAKNDDAPDSLASCMRFVGLIRGKE